MGTATYVIRRAHPRFPFFADAELNLRDGGHMLAQLSEIGRRGCYLDALEPIPVGTEMDLRISYGLNICEIKGKVIYKHSGGGLGVFGMGVLFGHMNSEQDRVIDEWLSQLSGQPAANRETSSAAPNGLQRNEG